MQTLSNRSTYALRYWFAIESSARALSSVKLFQNLVEYFVDF